MKTKAYQVAEFVVKPIASAAGGYGNRHKVTCSKCGQVIYDADPGNYPGVRWANHYGNIAVNEHRKACAGAALEASR